MKYSISFIFVFLLFIAACSGPLDTGNINIENWKNDRYGCSGLRIQDLDELEKIKNSYLGANNQ